jgi:lipoprotein NlpD
LVRGFQSGVSKGLDINGNVGDAVLAAGDGDVVYSGRGIQGSGDLIIIRHNDRYLSAYAHNSRMLVNEGSRVRAGEKIAEVGEDSAGVAMLHFEIREAGNSVDPGRLLPSK